MQPQLIAGRYQVLRAIGRGGMGTVWLCRDEVLDREVAVKQIGGLPGESATETKRAMREARSAAAFNHPNAVAVYDVVDHDARPWLVMEYVEGQTLADEISREGQLSPMRVADLGSQLAGALARAHERRIVHRDIKPANVLIDKAGRPKISDFGIARGHGDDQLTAIGFVTGTPGYLSPELARGEDPHPASDVWALGATLYAAVEGQAPYEPRSNPIALLRAIATERPRPMTHAGALGPAIDAMMHEDPARRWDMATSARRLAGIADVAPTAVMPTPGSTQRLESLAPAPALAFTQQLESPARTQASTQPLKSVAAPPVESTKRIEMPAPVPPADRGVSRSLRKPLMYAALLVAAVGIVLLLTQLGNETGAPAARATAGPTTPAKAPTTAPAQVSEAPPVSQPPVAGDRAQKKIERFVSSYYSDVTKHPEDTWEQLSSRMQNAAGGREGYNGFWRTIDKVRVNETRANASGTQAVVNLTFTRDDGTTSTETHQITFVTEDEDYLIDGDRLVR